MPRGNSWTELAGVEVESDRISQKWDVVLSSAIRPIHGLCLPQLTASCLRAMAKARAASSQSFLTLARIPRTCQVMWLVMSFLTAVRAIASASSCFGRDVTVAGNGSDECRVNALSASVSPWFGNFFRMVSAALSPFLYCLSSYCVCRVSVS